MGAVPAQRSGKIRSVTTIVVPGREFAAVFPHRYAVVDVETSGLSPRVHRVLSVAVVHVATDGTVEGSWSTLLDPGCDPGPVQIHGLTRERLAGSPTFDQIVDPLVSMLAGRVFVAHNATFDWQMISAEAQRLDLRLPIDRRLCTRVLARQLNLELPDLKLATLAAHWGVPQRRAHEADDDASVLATLLPELLRLAANRGADLPLVTCDAEAPAPAPDIGRWAARPARLLRPELPKNSATETTGT